MTTTEISTSAQNVNWLLAQFVDQTHGVHRAVAVSSDGLLMAMSEGLTREQADRFAAITSGMMSLARGGAQTFGDTGVSQCMIEMHQNMMFVSSISDGSALGVLTAKDIDMGLVGYEMTMLVDRVGQHLSPEVISELKKALQ